MKVNKSLLQILSFPDKILTRLVLGLIKIYQKTLSPDHSAVGKTDPFKGCKFYPSCSVYATQTFEKKGLALGLPKVLWRLLRCHPWSKGGVDEA